MNPLIHEGHGGVWGSSIPKKSGIASKPLDRSGPNLAHLYRFTREWTQANKLTPRVPRGIWRGQGVTNSKMWERCQTAVTIGNKFGPRMHIYLRMDMSETLLGVINS